MLLGFKKRFAKPILEGTKKFTIRDRRKVEPKIGERLYMYTGLRTKDCQKIGDDKVLVGVHLVDIQVQVNLDFGYMIKIRVSGVLLTPPAKDKFYRQDGFLYKSDFAEYWLQDVKTQKNGTRYVEKLDLLMYAWEGPTV